MSVKDTTSRLARWSLTLQGYDFTIIHKPGKLNQDADALSRHPTHQILAITTNEMKTMQENDELCIKLKEEIANNQTDDFTIKDRMVYKKGKNGFLRLVLPSNLKTSILHENHYAPLGGHQGITQTSHCIHKQYYWPNMDNDIKAYVKSCIICGRTKSPRQTLYRQTSSKIVSTFSHRHFWPTCEIC